MRRAEHAPAELIVLTPLTDAVLGRNVRLQPQGQQVAVAIAWLGYACGECRYCIDSWETQRDHLQSDQGRSGGTCGDVAIFGIVGHLALQYARIAGGFVIAVDVEDHKLAMATELGTDHVVNARTSDPVEAPRPTAAQMWPSRWPPPRRPTDQGDRRGPQDR